MLVSFRTRCQYIREKDHPISCFSSQRLSRIKTRQKPSENSKARIRKKIAKTTHFNKNQRSMIIL